MIRVLLLSILALVQTDGQTFDFRTQHLTGLLKHRPLPLPPGTGGAGVPPVRHPFAQHQWSRRQRRSVPVGPFEHSHPRESHMFHPHNGPSMMNFVPPAHSAEIPNHRHRRAAPAAGPAAVPLRTGVHPHVQHFHVQQQHQAALHQAALRRGGNGGRHVIKQRSVPSGPFDPQPVSDERLAQGPLRGPLPLGGFVHQPPRSNGPRPFVQRPPRLQRPLGSEPVQHNVRNQGGKRGFVHPNSPRNLPFVAGNYDPDQHSTTKPETTTSKPTAKSSWF